MSNLEKKIEDLGTGTKIGDGYDYSHILSPKHQEQGYRLTVSHHPDHNTIAARLQDATGHLIGSVTCIGKHSSYAPQVPEKTIQVGSAYLKPTYRGKGLGTNLYEAAYAHAANHLGHERVVGGIHSTNAHQAHQRVAAKHGLNYSAEEQEEPLPDDEAYRPGEYDDAYGRYSYALKQFSKSDADSESAHAQAAFPVHQDPAFAAAAFLSGKTTDPAAARAAFFQADGDIHRAALIAHGLAVNESNLKALIAAQGLSKAEPDSIQPPAPKEILAAQHQGDDVAQAVQRAFKDGFVFELLLSGKHSSGTLVARDQKTGNTWMLKPGDADPGPAAGVREEGASQSAREAAFYHVAKLWGLYDYVPRAELLLLDGKQVAAMEFLGDNYKTLAKVDDTAPNAGRQILGPLLRNGTLHQLALLCAVLGESDGHSNNVMVDGEGHVKLIDHGAAFAGPDFDPGNDQNSFIPAILRAWAPTAFSKLSPEDKLRYLPRVSAGIAEQLKSWVNGLHAEELEHTLLGYGIDPSATLTRFHRLKAAVIDQPLDAAVNRFWVTT